MESPGIFKYEKYSFKVISPLMVLLTVAFMINGEYIGGSICFVLGVLSAFSFQGIIIDTAGKRFMKYDRFLKFNIGGWKPLPIPSYVTVVRINISSRRTAPSYIVGPQDKKGARAFKVNLVVEGKMRYIGICRGSLENMTKEALRLGEYLQLRVLDYTTHEKKWIL
ncbi:MAG: hypothetical protein KAS29_05565 [Bacteroidales bacterium]|nr:hypothetical protein [Bacteroidales bacterium]